MTRQQRTSKSQLHNRMKRAGYRWFRRGWWESWRWRVPLAVRGDQWFVYHADHEEGRP